MKILVVCTGNRCRSQMAHGILQHLNPTWHVCSAGTQPAAEVHPLGIKVMQEIGIDISHHYPKSIEQYLGEEWDYVITVCGGAKEKCPVFTGKVAHRLHIGFDDPDAFRGTEEEVLPEFRRVRDEIMAKMQAFAETLALREAILTRRSVRKYIDRPIETALVSKLQEKVDEVNADGGLHIQLVTNEPRAFKGKMAYGTFSGVSNYFAMVGTRSDDLSERIGYYGEKLVLLAQSLGLNTCWVGLTYNNIKEAYEKEPDEKLCCMIALGYGDDAGRNLKRKTVDDVSGVAPSAESSSAQTANAFPAWFRRGVEAAILAPTAVNQQKFFFTYLGPDAEGVHRVRAERRFSLIGYTKMDLGIAKLHFELGAGRENFEWE